MVVRKKKPVCVKSNNRRGSKRSTREPAQAPPRSRGTNIALVVRDSRRALLESFSTNHEMATACIMVPDAERTWEPNHQRYDRTCIAEATVRRLNRRLSSTLSWLPTVETSAGSLTGDQLT